MEVLKNIAYFTIGSGILAFLIKVIAKHFLDKDFEKYRLNLHKLVEEHKIRYSKLYEERAHVLKNLYQKLVTAHDSIHSLVRPMQWSGEKDSAEKMKIAVTGTNDFIWFYSQNKIFFSKKTCESLESIISTLKTTLADFQMKEVYKEDMKFDQNAGKEHMKLWTTAWDRINKEAPKALATLEDEFRVILGVEQ